MISAKMLAGKVYCGQRGCTRVLGRYVPRTGLTLVGDDILVLSLRWHWDQEARPPRWRRSDHNRQDMRFGAAGGAVMARGQGGSTEKIATWHEDGIHIVLPTLIECPGATCRTRQNVRP